ncbi:MAG: type IX secretion system membrane protein PorP/SprF [Bacteroidales bacterium]|jgi:type IX secretion system PorP/SprF family membrane protein|nr:type IX secretion system membrane protein PorP/SprF [Bacteroidales bacterium]
MKIRLRARVFLFIILCGVGQLMAQQEPLNTMYMYNGIAVNPAYAGTTNALSLTALYRQQWVGMSAAPVTTSVSLHSPVGRTNMGVGMNFMSNKVGPVNDLYVNLYYAYRVALQRNLTLSLGLNIGVYSYNANLSSLVSDEQGQPDIALTDESRTTPNGGTGAYLYGENFFVGFAIPKLFQIRLDAYPQDGSAFQQHYYWSAGYVFHLSDRYALKPSVLTKLVTGAPVSYDLNLQLFLYESLSVGVSYRIRNSVAFMAGYHVTNKWMIGYSYDLAISELSPYNNGSHEFLLSYDLSWERSIVQSPRYF